jgi:hypothetical protein
MQTSAAPLFRIRRIKSVESRIAAIDMLRYSQAITRQLGLV